MPSQELEKQSEQHLTLSEKLALRRSNSDYVLLLDTSGSMSTDIEPEVSRISALRKIVQDLSTNPKMFFFESHFGECTKETIPVPAGCTYLAPLILHLKSIGVTKAIVITDGEMTDQLNTLDACKDFQLKIMYVGSEQRPEFLDKLAAQSGGFATTEDLKAQKQLTNKIQLLLDFGSSKESEKERAYLFIG